MLYVHTFECCYYHIHLSVAIIKRACACTHICRSTGKFACVCVHLPVDLQMCVHASVATCSNMGTCAVIIDCCMSVSAFLFDLINIVIKKMPYTISHAFPGNLWIISWKSGRIKIFFWENKMKISWLPSSISHCFWEITSKWEIIKWVYVPYTCID